MSLAITCGDTVWNYMKFHHKFKRNLLFAVRIGGRFLTNNKTADRAERRKAVFNWQKILKLAHLCKGGCLRSRLGDWFIILKIYRGYIQPMFSIPTDSTFVDPPPLRHKGEACGNVFIFKIQQSNRDILPGRCWHRPLHILLYWARLTLSGSAGVRGTPLTKSKAPTEPTGTFNRQQSLARLHLSGELSPKVTEG